MRIRDGQIDDQVDLAIGEKLFDRLRLDAIFLGFRLGSGRVQVGAGQNPDALEQR
ncbi:hypothetical protein D3C80_401130 [compost metagenome]